MLGWWDAACPVKTDNTNVLATVYKNNGKALIALASWTRDKTDLKLTVDWKSLGLDPRKTRLHAPAIDGYLPVEPGRGWLLVAEKF